MWMLLFHLYLLTCWQNITLDKDENESFLDKIYVEICEITIGTTSKPLNLNVSAEKNWRCTAAWGIQIYLFSCWYLGAQKT